MRIIENMSKENRIRKLKIKKLFKRIIAHCMEWKKRWELLSYD